MGRLIFSSGTEEFISGGPFSEPVVEMAGFESDPSLQPVGRMVHFGAYRLIPNSRDHRIMP